MSTTLEKRPLPQYSSEPSAGTYLQVTHGQFDVTIVLVRFRRAHSNSRSGRTSGRSPTRSTTRNARRQQLTMTVSSGAGFPCRTCFCRCRDDCVRGEFPPCRRCRDFKRGQDRCVAVLESLDRDVRRFMRRLRRCGRSICLFGRRRNS